MVVSLLVLSVWVQTRAHVAGSEPRNLMWPCNNQLVQGVRTILRRDRCLCSHCRCDPDCRIRWRVKDSLCGIFVSVAFPWLYYLNASEDDKLRQTACEASGWQLWDDWREMGCFFLLRMSTFFWHVFTFKEFLLYIRLYKVPITTNVGETFKSTLGTTHELPIMRTHLAWNHSCTFPALALSVSAGSPKTRRLEEKLQPPKK